MKQKKSIRPAPLNQKPPMNKKLSEAKQYEIADRSGEYIYTAWIKYLETMAEMWPVKLAMLKADQEGDWERVDSLQPELTNIAQRARVPLTDALRWRILARELYEQNEDYRKKEDGLCAEDPIRFFNFWCFTSDPRLPPLGIPAMIPFVLWPKQEEFILWVNDAYKAGRSWLAEKSRGWGLTWLLSAYYVWHWRFHDGFVGGFGSRDKDAVDKIGDPDTIFAKVRFLVYNLPPSMQPEAYRGRSPVNMSQYDNYLRVQNPDNDSVIRGEGGENIGAGGRASIYVVDESALVPHPEKIDDALSYTTNCRGDVSTVRGMNAFGEKRHSGRVRVFTCWYYQDPSKYAGWRENRRPSKEQSAYLEHEILDKGELVVNQELLMDYSRSVEDSFIPADWVQAAVDFDIPADGERQAGFDVAGSGDNKSVYTHRVGPVAGEPIEINFDTPQEALECALGYAEDDKTGLFAYDQDGIGESVWGHIKVTERKIRFDLLGIHGNSAASEKYLYADGVRANEKFVNKRAENYWGLRERFRKTYEHRKGIRMYDYAELISIPNNTKLTTQLSQPKRIYGRNGKIGVEGKRDMRGRGVKSPDHADSLVNAFADPDKESLVVSDFNYREDEGNIKEFEIDPESPIGEQYVAIVTEGGMTYALACWWLRDAGAPLLRVFWEFVEPVTEVKKLVAQVKSVMCEELKPIRAWVASDDMFAGLDKTNRALWFEYRREKATLRKNFKHDYSTSILAVNQLFSNKVIQVHNRCDRLCNQLTHWRMEKGKPREGLGFAMALCQLVTYLRTKQQVKKEHLSPEWKQAVRIKRSYKGSAGRFGRTAGEEKVALPAYYRMAKKQVEGRAREAEAG